MEREKAEMLADFWNANYHKMSGAAFWDKFGLKSYPWVDSGTDIRNWDKSIECATDALNKELSLLASLADDDKAGIDTLEFIRSIEKYLSKVVTKWFYATGHSIRMEKNVLRGNWRSACRLRERWTTIVGVVDIIDGNLPIFGMEKFKLFDTEEELIRHIVAFEVTKITQKEVYVNVPADMKGQFIGKGGDSIKCDQILCNRRIIIN